jgi:hypothetical protein
MRASSPLPDPFPDPMTAALLWGAFSMPQGVARGNV